MKWKKKPGKIVIYTSMYEDIIDNMKDPLKK